MSDLKKALARVQEALDYSVTRQELGLSLRLAGIQDDVRSLVRRVEELEAQLIAAHQATNTSETRGRREQLKRDLETVQRVAARRGGAR